jgi:ribosomal protein L11 methylase PrmA
MSASGSYGPVAASFRDPSGFVFRRDGVLYRQVNLAYREHYDLLVQSGLVDQLIGAGLLVPHEEAEVEPWRPASAYRILRPEPIPFVSYPYEWSFSQLKDAALLTLEIQHRALEAGLTLKDASAFNVQFRGASPVFIDTLSFELLHEGQPWVAYRQFCQHFLAPLALMSRVDVRLGQLLRVHLEGIPLDLAARMLPRLTWLRPGLLLHLLVHARFQTAHADTRGIPAPGAASKTSRRGFSKRSMLGLIGSLRDTIADLRWTPPKTEWAEYIADNTYTDAARSEKRRLVAKFLDLAAPSGTVWDLGANTGEYSRLAAARGCPTTAFDLDPVCVERNYLDARRACDRNLLPLLTDLRNPSPACGWGGRERQALRERGPASAVMALALVHHLAIGHNVPLADLAEFFHELGPWLIVEFVPNADPQTQRLLRGREDIFDAYSRSAFEAAFQERYTVERAAPIPDSERILYLMKRRGSL